MEITSFLERIAERESSFILYEGRVFSIIDSGKSSDFLQAGEIQLPIMPSLSYREWELLDEQLQRKSIESYSREFVKDTIDKELRAESELKQEESRIHALHYIMEEFLPYLLSKKYVSDELLQEEIFEETKVEQPLERAKKEIREKLTADFGNMEMGEKQDPAERMRQSVLKKEKREIKTGAIVPQFVHTNGVPKSLLGEITAYQPLYVVDGKVFALYIVGRNFLALQKHKAAKKDQFVFNIDGKILSLSKERLPSLKEIEHEFIERSKKKWRINALERSQDAFDQIKDQIETKEVTGMQMHELAKLDEYDLGECGFILKNGDYYVYSRLPKFVTQDGRNHDVFWPYEATRVAIKIGWDKKPYTTGNPLIVEKREFHPCLKGRSSGGYRTLCNLSRNPRDYRNTISDMIRKLSDAANVFLQPLNKSSLDSHSGYRYFGDHLDNILKQGSMTREQAIEKRYMVVEVIEKKITLEGDDHDNE